MFKSCSKHRQQFLSLGKNKNSIYYGIICGIPQVLLLDDFCSSYTRWPTKMPLFFFGNNFYKNQETFKIFSPQLLEVYRILLVETTLESMFYYNFSVINTMLVPCTALLYDSTAALSYSSAVHGTNKVLITEKL